MAEDKKDRLVKWLDQHAFEPILRKSPDDYKGEDRNRFEHVRRATESEKARYQGYESAEKVRRMFLDDLNSGPARKVDHDLDRLGLPKLPDLKDQILKLCGELGVK